MCVLLQFGPLVCVLEDIRSPKSDCKLVPRLRQRPLLLRHGLGTAGKAKLNIPTRVPTIHMESDRGVLEDHFPFKRDPLVRINVNRKRACSEQSPVFFCSHSDPWLEERDMLFRGHAANGINTVI